MSAPATLESLAQQVADLTRAFEAVRASVPSVMLDLVAAAEYTGISTRQLRRLVADDAIPYRRYGRSLRFPMAQLTAKPRPPRV